MSNYLDVAVGLTEAFISGIGKGSDWFKLVGTYVQSPLCWAISTGINRDLKTEDDICGKNIGISRIGSGSYVMPFVLAYQKEWKDEYKFTVLQNFKNLRDAVNLKEGVEPADAFMWEIFTTKKYYTNGEIKNIGRIYTPWPSWVITASTDVISSNSTELSAFLKSVQEGIEYFKEHQEEAAEWISSNLDYSIEDAKAWLETVTFSDDTSSVDPKVVKKTIDILKAANVLTDKADSLEYVVKV